MINMTDADLAELLECARDEGRAAGALDGEDAAEEQPDAADLVRRIYNVARAHGFDPLGVEFAPDTNVAALAFLDDRLRVLSGQVDRLVPENARSSELTRAVQALVDALPTCQSEPPSGSPAAAALPGGKPNLALCRLRMDGVSLLCTRCANEFHLPADPLPYAEALVRVVAMLSGVASTG